MARRKQGPLHPDAPLLEVGHGRPVSRRDFLGRGLLAGGGMVLSSSLLSLLLGPRLARGQTVPLSGDMQTRVGECGIATQGAGKVPFIAFDLAGGANIAGSNVLAGRQGGQLDFLTTAGYSRLGLPGDMIPQVAAPGGGSFVNTELGLAFHSDSGFLRGILEKTSAATRANVHGAVVPARSDNDTGNNPHNPMYGIARIGADGELLTLIGSRNSDSGGNSMAPAELIDPRVRPTKIDRPSDATGLVDTGDLTRLLSQADGVRVLESAARLSARRMDRLDLGLADATRAAEIRELVECGYVKTADLLARFGDPAALDPRSGGVIVGPGGIFSEAEFDGDGEFRKTASVMKLVIDGQAGAGTITMGGYDYHTGDRATGERRDLRAGRSIGACLEYAARVGVPLMVYVFSDGSVASNGRIDDSMDGRGKGEWTGDNSSTAASFFLVYNPNGRPVPTVTLAAGEGGPQIGFFRGDGSVETASSPAANNVNLLVNTVLLNYTALHGDGAGAFAAQFPGHGLGSAAALDALTAFEPVVSGTIGG